MRMALSGREATYFFALRAFLVVFSCVAIWWGAVTFPVFRVDSPIERIATHIIAGAPFKSEILQQQLPTVTSIEKAGYCHAPALRSAAIIQLRMLETAISGNDRQYVAAHLQPMRDVIRSSLSCAPADPFLWLVLYWVANTESGSTAKYLNYMQMSYRLGPNEGWIALKRNPLAFQVFKQLPPELAQSAVDEFISLVESRFYEQAAEIFVGAAWPEHDLILSHLAGVNDQDRQLFADALHRHGSDIDVPGVPRRDQRPWHGS